MFYSKLYGLIIAFFEDYFFISLFKFYIEKVKNDFPTQ